MTVLAIRQSGGANIVSIPKAVLKMLDLHTGSALDLSIENDKIILTPVQELLTLEEVLAGSPKKKLALTKEDRDWMDMKSVGEEF